VPGSYLAVGAFSWVALLGSLLAMLLLADAAAGHLARGFDRPAQYVPFAVGVPFALIAVAAAVAGGPGWAAAGLRLTGWLMAAAGLIGTGFHHWHGMARKPGGYRWALHHAMYGAPPLAPLGLALVGVIGMAASAGIAGETHALGIALRPLLLLTVAMGLAGALLQAAVLHLRGAFNNALMYLPFTAPLLAAALAACATLAPAPLLLAVTAALFWLTALVGFIGLGMHLRGFDRQRGGLFLPFLNWLSGPPAMAPSLFVALAFLGLTAIHLIPGGPP